MSFENFAENVLSWQNELVALEYVNNLLVCQAVLDVGSIAFTPGYKWTPSTESGLQTARDIIGDPEQTVFTFTPEAIETVKGIYIGEAA